MELCRECDKFRSRPRRFDKWNSPHFSRVAASISSTSCAENSASLKIGGAATRVKRSGDYRPRRVEIRPASSGEIQNGIARQDAIQYFKIVIERDVTFQKFAARCESAHNFSEGPRVVNLENQPGNGSKQQNPAARIFQPATEPRPGSRKNWSICIIGTSAGVASVRAAARTAMNSSPPRKRKSK